MAKVGIFYGSTTGVTESVAQKISNLIDGSDVFDISGNDDKLENYDVLILGTSTWGFGDLQDDWQVILDKLSSLNLSGKKVAYFGTGDLYYFADTFIDGVGIIHDEISKTGATIIGQVPLDGYNYGESRAVRNGQFIGLPIDEVTEAELTDERVERWVEKLKESF